MAKVYFDSVSSTNVDEEVLNTYKQLLDKYYCNSDALYDDGVAIYDMQEKARENIASLLNVEKEEVIFTSGASESNSTAIKGVALAQKERKHIISTVEEHHSLLNALMQLEENFDYEVTYIKPNQNGVINPEEIKNALRKDTILVSVMACNNELGLINDINEIKKIVKANPGTYFHCDVTQAIGKIDIDFKDIDLASMSAHKIHGLKGSGLLIKKKHVKLLPLINGGQQEFALRGGTSNALVNIVLAKTLRLALERQNHFHDSLVEMNRYFVNKLNEIDKVKVNVFKNSLPTLISITTTITSEVMLNALNLKGIMVSSKSTCGSRKNSSNLTLDALNIDSDHSIRISFDYLNTKEEIDYFIDCLKEIVSKYG